MELSAPAIDYLILNIAAPITAVATTGTVEAAEGLEIPTIPAGRWLSARAVNAASADRITFEVWQGSDEVLITDVTVDTLTFVRTATARAIAAGELLVFAYGAFEANALKQHVLNIEAMLLKMTDGSVDHIPRYDSDGAPSELLVSESAPQAMTVLIQPGHAWIDGRVAGLLEEATSAVIVAPATTQRIDVIELLRGSGGLLDRVNVVTGVESGTPATPAVSSGGIALASVLTLAATSAITDADITDLRVRR